MGSAKTKQIQIKNFEKAIEDVFSNNNITTIKLRIPSTLNAAMMKLLENSLMSTARDKLDLTICCQSHDIDKKIIRLISIMNSWIKSFN